jgi:dienelactone hydrolase
MKKKYQQIIGWIKTRIISIEPGKNAIKGASIGILSVTALFWLIYTIGVYIGLGDEWVLLFLLVFMLAAVLFGFVARWIINLLSNLPRFYKLSFLIALPLLIIMSFDWMIPALILLLASLSGAAFLVLKKTGFQNLTIAKKIITIIGVIIGYGGFITAGILYSQDGFDVDPMINAAASSQSNIQQITQISPAEKGPYQVKTLTYGSGKDLHRPEYGAEVDIKTDSVNGLPFIDDWDGFSGWWREKYWGFDSRSLPINARVWYPEGAGSFPLALVVHGNHGMQDYSDTGYEYLGELLASKGIILASVDENFINGSWSNIFGGLDKENDARGWLLLEHLKVFHEWNKTEGHLFHRKIDTSNLALIGHSRGGEAVAHAAMFNKLPRYPDDASVKFDYNYNIKSIVAIAPVDGQYEVGDSRTKIEDINYFVIHGAQDGDVSSYMGSQQYERVKFKDSLYHFKAGLYVYGANHGQFNSSWGHNDTSNPFSGLLNLKQLLSDEAQKKIAEVYIGSFLDITLKNKHEYLPLFVDARKGKDWLPETIYLNQFEDSNLKSIANFDEDFDVSTITQHSGFVNTKNLSVWREQEIQLKWQKKGSRALFVGWNYDIEEEKEPIESVPDSLVASYTMNLSSTAIDSSAVLVFSMAESKESANPKSEGKWVESNTNNNSENEEKEKKDDEKDEDVEDKKEPKEPIDFTIQLTDSFGQETSFLLSDFSPLQRAIEVMITKTGFIKDDIQSEKVYQTFYFPIQDIQKTSPDFDFSTIETISFIFNKNKSGVISIDNIGFMKPL